MLLQIDSRSVDPLYLQIHDQIVAGIATGELTPGESLPSVRALASDLGINLHTVNKAYAVLRDEGFITMRGRAGARIADPRDRGGGAASKDAQEKIAREVFDLALAFRARGGTKESFLCLAAAQVDRAFDAADRSAADERGAK